MIKTLTLKHISEIAKVHAEALKNDFLPTLGTDFLELIYMGVIKKKDAFGFIEEKKGKIVGFIIGTKDIKRFFSTALKSNFFKLIYLMLIKVLNKPPIIKNILETLLYTKKEKGPKAELVVIAVVNKWQGKGIGKKLIESLEGKFKKDRVNKYKLTVHADKRAINFYKKLRYLKLSEFNLYGKQWYIYEKTIN